jgi:hypothetical protein
MGDDWQNDAFPLNECEGDCDFDNDCAGSLICYQLEEYEQGVPGCTGSAYELKDYCAEPIANNDIAYTFTGEDGTKGVCEGDCDSNWDCEVSNASRNLPRLFRQHSHPKCLATTSHVAE